MRTSPSDARELRSFAFAPTLLEVTALGLWTDLAKYLRHLLMDPAVGRENLRPREVQ